MSGWIVLAIIVLFVFLCFYVALREVLLQSSDGELERELANSDRLERGRWMLGRQLDLATAVQWKSTAIQCAIVLLVLLDLCGFERVDVLSVLLAFLISLVLLWLATGVIGLSIARHVGISLAVRLSAPLQFALGISRPLIATGRFLDEMVRRITGANLKERDAEEELLRSVEESQRTGGLDDVAAEMIENVVEFADTDVSSVMTPRTDIEGIEYTDDLAAIRDFIEHAGHSRIPVYADSLDEIEGILYVKDLIQYLGERAADFRLRPLLREAIRVPETKQVGDLLRDFQTAEIHMAIVIDEYGGTSGLVTIEDVLEEIVGEIHDEHEPDDDEEATCLLVEEGVWDVDGRFSLQDLDDHLEIVLPEEMEPETVAGFVLEHFGRVPSCADSFDALGYRFHVMEASDTRIERVRIERIHERSEVEDGSEAQEP
ncbi:MAG: hemolysin family protein [Planctomycetota bacterium]|nr:hemolysin family protein [Planctomycetota bacterium]